MVLVADNNHQSSVTASYTIFITYVLRHAERVVILNTIDNNDDRFNAQLCVQPLQRRVHLVNR